MSTLFKDRLKEVRQTRKLSQSALADKSGLQSTAISHFETGSRAPSFDNLRKLADALEVTTDFLLGRSDGPKAVGPTSDTLFRHLEDISTDDMAFLESMAEQLAQKNQKKKES